jgi:hypothetical protein
MSALMPCLPFLQVTNQTTILLEDSLHLNGLIYLVCRNKEFTKKGIKQILWIMAAIIREHDEESISREQEEASHKTTPTMQGSQTRGIAQASLDNIS